MRLASLFFLGALAACHATGDSSSSTSAGSASPLSSPAIDGSTLDAAIVDAALPAPDASSAVLTSPSRSALTDSANAVRDALVAHDMHRFASLVHPTRGVRFSPYAYIETTSDVVLHANEIESSFASPKKRTWGAFDGSGDPIVLTFRAYLTQFVAFSELAHLSPRPNATVASGNTVNNQRDVYGNAPYVEYYFPGKKDALEWEALRIVFEPVGEKLFVVGIVHDVWTI